MIFLLEYPTRSEEEAAGTTGEALTLPDRTASPNTHRSSCATCPSDAWLVVRAIAHLVPRAADPSSCAAAMLVIACAVWSNSMSAQLGWLLQVVSSDSQSSFATGAWNASSTPGVAH